MVCAAFLAKYLDLSLHCRALITCQWFFTALSVRPGKSLAMVAHLFPCTRWEARRRSSSSSVKGFLLILGSNWLNHLNLQLFPDSIVKQHLDYQPKLIIYSSNWNIPSYRTPLRKIEGIINKNSPIISTFAIRKKLVHLSSLIVPKVENWVSLYKLVSIYQSFLTNNCNTSYLLNLIFLEVFPRWRSSCGGHIFQPIPWAFHPQLASNGLGSTSYRYRRGRGKK